MSLSRVTKVGDGVSNQFAVNFALGYLDESDVTARVGTEVDGLGDPSYRTITFLTDSLLQISGSIADVGVPIVFERTVAKEELLVNFSNGDVLEEVNLDTAQKQTMMSVHEVLDGRFGAFAQDVSAGGFRFTNVGRPVEALDAVNKEYVDSRVNTNAQYFNTKALALAAVSGLADGTVVEIQADESHSGLITRYTVLAGALVFKFIVVFPVLMSPRNNGAIGVDASDGPAAVLTQAAMAASIADGQLIANSLRHTGRLFLGSAALMHGTRAPSTVGEKTWVGNAGDGYMTYFEVRSIFASFSPIGEIAGSFATRSSDLGVGVIGTPTIAVAAYADNDSTAGDKAAWAYYGHSVSRLPNAVTVVVETDITSFTTLVNVNPYLMGAAGTTANLWLGVGGETAQGRVDAGFGSQLRSVSTAIAIINSAPSAAGNRYAKAIVIAANALLGTDGVSGSATAMELAVRQNLVWKFGSNENDVAGMIRITNASASTQQRIVIEGGAFQIKGVQFDKATETILFMVDAPALTAGQDVNYIRIQPVPAVAASASGLALLSVGGTSTIVGLLVRPKGALAAIELQDHVGNTKLSVGSDGLSLYGGTRIAKQTGVAVTAAAIHAALVNLGAFSA